MQNYSRDDTETDNVTSCYCFLNMLQYLKNITLFISILLYSESYLSVPAQGFVYLNTGYQKIHRSYILNLLAL